MYDRLANAPDDRARARVIAEAFEALEARYPHLPDLATRQRLSETELKLTREIEQVRADLSIEIARLQGRLLQWSFVFWLTQFAAILALLWRLWPTAGT